MPAYVLINGEEKKKTIVPDDEVRSDFQVGTRGIGWFMQCGAVRFPLMIRAHDQPVLDHCSQSPGA